MVLGPSRHEAMLEMGPRWRGNELVVGPSFHERIEQWGLFGSGSEFVVGLDAELAWDRV